MSSPPPSGPPSSPPPYPQQYPPQQPYYPQAAPPPPKKSNTLLIVVIVVVVVVVVAAIAWYAITLMFRPVTTSYTITAVSLTVSYPGSNHYFGVTTITACSDCPIGVSITSPGAYHFSLTNQDTATHNVTDITISGLQFYLFSASPDPTVGTPVAVGAGATQSFTLEIGSTGLTGSSTLTGTISTN